MVAPYVGAWIETLSEILGSLTRTVAPYVGAWIETGYFAYVCLWRTGRTLRGCVD